MNDRWKQIADDWWMKPAPCNIAYVIRKTGRTPHYFVEYYDVTWDLGTIADVHACYTIGIAGTLEAAKILAAKHENA